MEVSDSEREGSEQPRDQAVRPRAMQPPSVRAVTIPFADLRDRSKDLGGFIEEGFGPRGLGIVSIADVPGYPELRKRLLRLAPRIVNLPGHEWAFKKVMLLVSTPICHRCSSRKWTNSCVHLVICLRELHPHSVQYRPAPAPCM